MLRKTLMLSLALTASACSPQGDGSSSAPAVTARPEAAPVAAPVDTTATVVEGPNTLTLKPGHVFACDGRDRAVSTVGWSSSDPAVKGVTILVQAPEGGERKVFTEGGASGTAETGNWVMAGGKFFMVDTGSGKELAEHVVTAFPCQ